MLSNNLNCHLSALLIHTRRYGDEYGLRVALNIKHDEYVGLLGDRPGVKYIVHDPHERPLPEQNARVAPAGRTLFPFHVEQISIMGEYTTVGIEPRTILRLPPPYESRCMSALPNEYFNYAARGYIYRLTQYSHYDDIAHIIAASINAWRPAPMHTCIGAAVVLMRCTL